MPPPSRLLPKFQRRAPGFFEWALLAAAVGALAFAAVALLTQAPYIFGLIGAVVMAWTWHVLHARQQRLRVVAKRRAGQSICEFASDFDARTVDTWVIRAVFEQVQAELSDIHPDFPVRADDALLGHLIDDPDDLDLAIAEAVAERTGRRLEGVQTNPYFGNVHTVRDLVMFFNAQPRRGAGQASI